MERAPQQEEKSNKEILWDKNRAEVDKIADKLGKGIDEKIKEAVVAFRVYGFITSQSCEGHICEVNEKCRTGVPFPWIELYTPEPKGWKKSEEKKREWAIENLTQQQKMIGYLDEFYQGRETPFDARLTFRGIGVYGGFRIQSFGSETMTLLTQEEQIKKLELYRKEMDDFTNFLKDKYLSNHDSE